MNRHTPPPAGVVHDDWLAVSTEGFASMNAGRIPAHLVKELVQNALDALDDKPGRIDLTLQPSSTEGVVVTCRDDGCGMTNLHDIRTVFFTSKTDSHLQRGRMGRGFKEMLCLAHWATVESGPRRVEFVVEDGRRITREASVPDGQAIAGTIVTMVMPWTPDMIPGVESYFRGLLPPIHVQLAVNGNIIPPRAAAHRVDAALPTELFEDGKWVRPVRATIIELVPIQEGEEPQLYEMGIAVCPMDWTQPFHADALQRVPMNPCRDAVASGYLVKVHKACLPVLLPLMPPEQVLEDWVGNAAPGCAPEVQKQIIALGFGANIARSVPTMGVRQFDEDARDIGVKVVDTKQASGGFRTILQTHVPTTREAVDQHNQEQVAAAASGGFGIQDAYEKADRLNQRRRQLIESVGGKEPVQQVMEFARWFCQKLLDGYDDTAICSVRLALLKPVGAMATWGSDDVLTLGIDTPGIWLDPLGEDSLATYVHEVGHHRAMHHGQDFHKEMETLAGRAARVMLEHGVEVRRRWPGLPAESPRTSTCPSASV